jgi:hypothetical protein
MSESDKEKVAKVAAMSDQTILELVKKNIDTSELMDTMQHIKRIFWKGDLAENRNSFKLNRARARSYQKRQMIDKGGILRF